jgi:Eukaryotic initiation factor 4E
MTELAHQWDYYYHLSDEKSWDLESYKIISKNISNAEEVLFISELLHENLLKKCMFFLMRSGITPQWEDPKNRNGGCFSFKIQFKYIFDVWRHLFYATTGETLFIQKKNHDLLNGITISPKKNFCIIKLWFSNCSLQDPSILIQILNLPLVGCLFKKHEPEF